MINTSSVYADGGVGYKGIYINNKGVKTWYNVHDVLSWGFNECDSIYKFKKDGATNPAPSFDGVNFGVFNQTDVLEIAGFAVVGWTDNTDFVAGKLQYKVWKEGNSEPTTWNELGIGNYDYPCNGAHQVVCSSGNDRLVGVNNQSINIKPTEAGTYNFKVKALGRMNYCNGSFNPNDGPEYNATFTVVAPDYYRSVGNVTWSSPSNWEQSTDGGSTYGPATSAPSSGAHQVVVQSADTLTINSAATTPSSANFIINGTLNLASGGSVTTAPIYGVSSTLQYSGLASLPSTEWPMNVQSGAGYPNNVIISGNSTVTVNLNNISGATAVTEALYMGGDLTVENGSTFRLNIGLGISSDLYGSKAFFVAGDIYNNGILDMNAGSHLAFSCNDYINTGQTTLASNAKGGDLYITGNFTNNGSTTSVEMNGRAFILEGNANQTIGGTAPFSVGTGSTPFELKGWLIVAKTGGVVTLTHDIFVDGEGTDNGNTNSGGGAITVNGNNSSTPTILDLSGLNVKVSDTNLKSTIVCQNNGFIRTNPETTISVLGVYNSDDAISNIAFDQTTPGTTNKVGTLILNRTGSDAVLNNSNDFIVTSRLQILQGKLNSSADIRLDSLAVGTLSSTDGSTAALQVKDLIFTKATAGLMNSAQFYKNGRSLTITGKVRTLVHFEKTAAWNFVSFPYAATVTKMDGTTAVIGDDYSLGWYDPAARATNISGWKSSTDVPMTSMKGYIINKKTPLEDLYFDSSVQGGDEMFNSTRTLNLTYETAEHDVNAGWNFVSHPLSANGTPTLSGGVFAYGYNASQDAYKLYYYQYNPGYTYGSGAIKPFDAIFVKTPDADSVNVSYALSSPQGMLRRAAAVTNSPEEIIQLNLVVNNVAYETLLRVNANATTDADKLYDAPYNTPWKDTTPRIYTLIKGKMYALNSFPANSTIPVGIKVPTAGDFSFTWDNQATAYNAILTDKLTGTTVDMAANSSYDFNTTDAGDLNTRFEINVNAKVPSKVELEKNNSDYKISVSEGKILIDELNEPSYISVVDVTGKIVESRKINLGHAEFTIGQSGVYLLQISNNSGVQQLKVFVK